MSTSTKAELPGLDYRGLQVKMKPSLRKTIRKTKVIVEGNLTINTVKSFLDFVPQVFESYDYVDFYLQNVESLDLSFIQTFYRLKEVKKSEEKTVTVDASLPDDLKKIVTQSGFDKLVFKVKNV